MPCPLIESNNYPDYIKKILKEINSGNDSELKACACQLKTVLDDQKECAEQMSDGKLALFPFCIEDTETDPTTISLSVGSMSYWIYPVGMSLDDLMLLYWQNYSTSIVGTDYLACTNPSGAISARACGDIDKNYYRPYGNKIAIKENIKWLVCPSVFYATIPRNCFYNEKLYGCEDCITSSWGGLIIFNEWSGYPICYRYNNKYYPTISFITYYLSNHNPVEL